MSDSRACILDHTSLGELNNTFEYAGDSVLKVQKAISDYLHGVVDVMERRLEYVAQKLEEAKAKLEAARAQLAAAKEYLASAQSRLQSAQEQAASARDNLSNNMNSGEDGALSVVAGVVMGTANLAVVGATSAMVGAARADCAAAQTNCAAAEARCVLAEKEVQKWEKNHEIAKQAVSQCKAYKSDWEYQDIFVCGGDHHLDRLGHQRTDDATSKLRKILEILGKYLRISISPHGSAITEEVEVLNKYTKTKIIRDSDAKERKEQIHELNRHDAVAATRIAKCPKCGRPHAICICGNTRKNIELI